MQLVQVVIWAYDSDPPKIDSVWSTEAEAAVRADELLKVGDHHLHVWIRPFVLDSSVLLAEGGE